MKRIKILIILVPLLLWGMLTAFPGSAAAQHEGGLGIKKIPLNIATEKQLLKIPGMTEELAKAIVEYRQKVGFFKKPQDLLKVPGITKDIYKKLNPQVSPEGEIYCVPGKGSEEDEEEEEEPLLSPSKC